MTILKHNTSYLVVLVKYQGVSKMGKNYPEITKRISNSMKTLRKDISYTMQGFSSLVQAATQNGALDKKNQRINCIGYRAIFLTTLRGSFVKSSINSWLS